ncbi:hypothetical protein J1614_003681 [Plenodomus biglobosus]|nr:hypothetical protein J1614_003681 [Plenodomus biglobosus]
MEALAALGLAANVVQLTQFSLKTMSIFKKFSEDTSPAATVEENLSRLHALMNELDVGLSHAGCREPIKSDRSQDTTSLPLVQLAKDLLKTSSDLEAVLMEYNPNMISLFVKVVKAFKYQLSGRRKHARTRKVLQTRDHSTVIISSYLWNAGLPQQRKLRYVIASLLYQVLKRFPDTALGLLDKIENCHEKSTLEDWPERVLRSSLSTAITATHSIVFIFIDGLDELDNSFTEGLPKQFSALTQQPEILASLVALILRKAQGVFLWVTPVVSSILRGLDECDKQDTLIARIDSLPNELSQLYTEMWKLCNKNHKDHPTQSAKYLEILMLGHRDTWQALSRRASVQSLMPASDDSLQQLFMGSNESLSKGQLIERCVRFQNHLLARYAGFIEVQYLSRKNPDPYEHSCVNFVHKSVKDFLLKTDDGWDLLHNDKSTGQEIYARTLVAATIQLGIDRSPSVDRALPNCRDIVVMFNELRRNAGLMLGDGAVLRAVFAIAHKALSAYCDISGNRELICLATQSPYTNYIKFCISITPSSYPGTDSAKLIWSGLPGSISSVESRSIILGQMCQNMCQDIWVHMCPSETVSLITWLLHHDANPNLPVAKPGLNGTTGFQCFLMSIIANMYGSRKRLNNIQTSEAENMLNVLESFIDHRAAIRRGILIQLRHNFNNHHGYPHQTDAIPIYNMTDEEASQIWQQPRIRAAAKQDSKKPLKHPRHDFAMVILAECCNVVTDVKDSISSLIKTRQHNKPELLDNLTGIGHADITTKFKLKLLMRCAEKGVSVKQILVDSDRDRILTAIVLRREDIHVEGMLWCIFESMKSPVIPYDETLALLDIYGLSKGAKHFPRTGSGRADPSPLSNLTLSEPTGPEDEVHIIHKDGQSRISPARNQYQTSASASSSCAFERQSSGHQRRKVCDRPRQFASLHQK